MSENEGNRLLDWSSSRRHIEINLSIGHKTRTTLSRANLCSHLTICAKFIQICFRLWAAVGESWAAFSQNKTWYKLLLKLKQCRFESHLSIVLHLCVRRKMTARGIKYVFEISLSLWCGAECRARIHFNEIKRLAIFGNFANSIWNFSILTSVDFLFTGFFVQFFRFSQVKWYQIRTLCRQYGRIEVNVYRIFSRTVSHTHIVRFSSIFKCLIFAMHATYYTVFWIDEILFLRDYFFFFFMYAVFNLCQIG